MKKKKVLPYILPFIRDFSKNKTIVTLVACDTENSCTKLQTMKRLSKSRLILILLNEKK